MIEGYYVKETDWNKGQYRNTRKTWSLTLREEQRLNVFENKVLRRTCGPKRDKLIEDFAKYKYNYHVKEDKLGRACSMHGEQECI
jgi:hypothetical protein